jgi:hypothetical protein
MDRNSIPTVYFLSYHISDGRSFKNSYRASLLSTYRMRGIWWRDVSMRGIWWRDISMRGIWWRDVSMRGIWWRDVSTLGRYIFTESVDDPNIPINPSMNFRF